MSEIDKSKVKKERAKRISMSEFLNHRRNTRELTPFEKYVKTLCGTDVGKKK